MGVDEADRRFLARQIDEDARQKDVLEDVGETAGVEGVEIVHLRCQLPKGMADGITPGA